MTVLPPGMEHTRIRTFFTQLILVLLINVPSISFGLAMGWVSLESGADDGEEESGAALVAAAAVTFLAGALAMPVAARAIAAGRKPAMLATSAAFIVCWSLKLVGGWGVVAGRAAAGLGGTAAWVIPPMLAVEMCCARVRGAAAVALVLAHNIGFLLMYLAADYDVPHRTVLSCCLGLSVLHFIAYMFVPESPAYLAANGKYKEARVALAWCRGFSSDSTSSELDLELKTLPEPDLDPVSPFRLAKDMLSDVRRRKAFIIALVAVVGQEMCGVLTLLQFAERVFTLTRQGSGGEPAPGEGGRKPASDAVVLGAVQLVASALALYLVEKIGRRRLLVWGAVVTGVALAAGAGAVAARWQGAALAALAAAVFADSAGLQPAPYALLAEMFTYQYRGCASLLVTAASDLANAAEILVFPSVVRAAGLAPALALAALLTLALAAFATLCVPETMHRTPEQIYRILCPTSTPTPTPNPTDPRVHVEKDVRKSEGHDCDNDGVNHVNLERGAKQVDLGSDDDGRLNHRGFQNYKTEILNDEGSIGRRGDHHEEDHRGDVEVQGVKIKNEKENATEFESICPNITELDSDKGFISFKSDPTPTKEAFRIEPNGPSDPVPCCAGEDQTEAEGHKVKSADRAECDNDKCSETIVQQDRLKDPTVHNDLLSKVSDTVQTARTKTESTDM